MTNQIEDFQHASKTHLDRSSAAFASVGRGFQEIVRETTNYSKRSLEHTSSFLEKLFGAKSFDKAMELQAEFAKSQFEELLAQSAKIGEIYKNLAMESFKPTGGVLARVEEAVAKH